MCDLGLMNIFPLGDGGFIHSPVISTFLARHGNEQTNNK